MTNFCVVWRSGTTDNFQNSHFELRRVQFPDNFDKEEETKSLYSIARFVGKFIFKSTFHSAPSSS